MTEDIDFEIDPENLPDRVDREKPLGAPSVVVDDLHITYRVFGARRSGTIPTTGGVPLTSARIPRAGT